MGEVVEMMLDGTLCQFCGVYIGMDSGIPESCRDCKSSKKKFKYKKVKKNERKRKEVE